MLWVKCKFHDDYILYLNLQKHDKNHLQKSQKCVFCHVWTKKKFRNCGCLVYLLISQRDFHSRNYGWLVTNISLQSVKIAGFPGVNLLVLLVPSSPVLSSSSTVISHFSQQWSPFSLYNTWCSLKATFRMRRTSKALTSVKEGGVNTRRGDEEPHLIRAVAGKI